jgi:hypothetical protein
MSSRTSPLFRLGQLVATPNALTRVSQDDINAALQRHVLGDWGDLCDEDKKVNDRAIAEGARILSAYQAVDSTKFWIITEADRSVTTVLLPEDY